MDRDALANDSLLEQDPSYQRLSLEHQALELELDGLLGKAHLSNEDELEKRIIKKKKLQIKDAMEQVVQRDLETVSGSRITTTES